MRTSNLPQLPVTSLPAHQPASHPRGRHRHPLQCRTSITEHHRELQAGLQVPNQDVTKAVNQTLRPRSHRAHLPGKAARSTPRRKLSRRPNDETILMIRLISVSELAVEDRMTRMNPPRCDQSPLHCCRGFGWGLADRATSRGTCTYFGWRHEMVTRFELIIVVSLVILCQWKCKSLCSHSTDRL